MNPGNKSCPALQVFYRLFDGITVETQQVVPDLRVYAQLVVTGHCLSPYSSMLPSSRSRAKWIRRWSAASSSSLDRTKPEDRPRITTEFSPILTLTWRTQSPIALSSATTIALHSLYGHCFLNGHHIHSAPGFGRKMSFSTAL